MIIWGANIKPTEVNFANLSEKKWFNDEEKNR